MIYGVLRSIEEDYLNVKKFSFYKVDLEINTPPLSIIAVGNYTDFILNSFFKKGINLEILLLFN